MDNLSRPRVIVRFFEDPEIEGFSDPHNFFAERDPALYKRLTRQFGSMKLMPVFSEKTRKILPVLQKKAAEQDPTYEPTALTTFFYLETEKAEDLAELVKILLSSSAVQSADLEIPGPDPLVDASNDPLAATQGYLDPAPNGINARYAWTFPGGDGEGQRVIDIEQGWTFDHEDLVDHGITLLNGTIVNTSRGHGTAVFGELCAIDNAIGCVGIAPHVASVLAASRNPSLANSIVEVLESLDFGDVMLLETQDTVTGFDLGPSELVDATYEAVRLATALGIVVVAAGGNGGNDLDLYANTSGRRVMWRNASNPDFRDSGAIIVAAASSAAPHMRMRFSTFGARIDCFGWGENVVTCFSNASGSTTAYTTTFNGTSSASPIVAGAALCIQGICQMEHDFRLSPRAMRQILSDLALNTAPASSETAAIGVMPDLRNIINEQLGIVPDVYIRDNIGDVGDPHDGVISASPDIIVRPVAVAAPQVSFGAGSGTENDAMLGFEVEAGQDNYIYVRALNRSSTEAINVNASIFWAPVSTLVTPDHWNLIGSVTIPSVPGGDILTCSDALVWPYADIPAPGHYCYVGILGTVSDPGPAPADFLDFDNFRSFIRNNNNVTWRNFNVVDRDPADPEQQIPLLWIIPGAPDKPRVFAVELGIKLPRRAEILLELPLQLLREMKTQLTLIEVNKVKDRAIARLPSRGQVRFGPGHIPAKARHEMKLLVRTNSTDKNTIFRIEARQLYEGKEEVGRVAWFLDPRAGERLEKARRENT
jgi:hypothetical protein